MQSNLYRVFWAGMAWSSESVLSRGDTSARSSIIDRRTIPIHTRTSTAGVGTPTPTLQWSFQSWSRLRGCSPAPADNPGASTSESTCQS